MKLTVRVLLAVLPLANHLTCLGISFLIHQLKSLDQSLRLLTALILRVSDADKLTVCDADTPTSYERNIPAFQSTAFEGSMMLTFKCSLTSSNDIDFSL